MYIGIFSACRAQSGAASGRGLGGVVARMFRVQSRRDATAIRRRDTHAGKARDHEPA